MVFLPGRAVALAFRACMGSAIAVEPYTTECSPKRMAFACTSARLCLFGVGGFSRVSGRESGEVCVMPIRCFGVGVGRLCCVRFSRKKEETGGCPSLPLSCL